MRKTCVILIMLSFTAIFSAGKATANIQAASVKLCFGYDMTTTHAKQKVSTTIKDNLLTSYFQENGDIEDENFDKKGVDSPREKFVLFTSFTIRNSALFKVVHKSNYKKDYGDPYNTIVLLPIYIRHHALIIPFL